MVPQPGGGSGRTTPAPPTTGTPCVSSANRKRGCAASQCRRPAPCPAGLAGPARGRSLSGGGAARPQLCSRQPPRCRPASPGEDAQRTGIALNATFISEPNKPHVRTDGQDPQYCPLAHGRERRREPESGECGLPPPLAPACPPMPACLPCHPLPRGISLPVGLTVVLKPPVCIPCRGDRCQGHDEEGGAGQSAACKMARVARVPHPVGSSVSLGPDLQPSRLLCRFAGLRHGSALAGGCRSAGCVLSVAQVAPHSPGQ